jgi:general secretion pathway protein E
MEVLERPHGILLVTGPMGSGKTTTLYASMQHLNVPGKKIVSIEDPVEYQLDGVHQVHVKPQIGLSFETALRFFVRQDLDVMMVGEIRDTETARMAAQAALIGRTVLSTLHTNDAASSVTRLLNMGIEDFLLTATVNGIVAQRLVRTLCRACKEPAPELLAEFRREAASADGAAGGTEEPLTFYRARGCERCGGTGFHGRTTILEILVMSDRIREMILARAEAKDIQRAAIEEGMVPMYRYGMRKVRAGLTTREEVLRVIRDV